MRPNIVLITSHDVGRHLGCYGQKTVRTPALDRLAAEGALFANSFCTAPQCGPSRAALHTGRHAHANGMLGQAHAPFNWTLNAGEQHIAARLRDHGYDTVLVGLQHVSQQPETLGYNRIFPRQPAPDLGQTAAQLLADFRDADRPFYMEIGFVEPHRPFDRGGSVPPDASLGVDLPAYAPDTPEARQDFAALQGCIRHMDEGIAPVLRALDDPDLRDRTWVIFVADHGLPMPRAKGNLYDPGIETALVMRWPAIGLAGGQRIEHLISHVDLVPTLLHAVGAGVPPDLHGRSFWPLLTGENYTPNQHIFAEKTFHTAYEPMRCVRTERNKLILNLDAGAIVVPADAQSSPFYPQVMAQVMAKRPPLELYDLTADPTETNNLAGQSAAAEIETALIQTLRRWMESTGDPVLAGAVTSNYQRDALKRLYENS